MKSLYHKNGRLTAIGRGIDAEMVNTIRPLFAEYSKKYSVRELAHLVNHAINYIECETILGLDKD